MKLQKCLVAFFCSYLFGACCDSYVSFEVLRLQRIFQAPFIIECIILIVKLKEKIPRINPGDRIISKKTNDEKSDFQRFRTYPNTVGSYSGQLLLLLRLRLRRLRRLRRRRLLHCRTAKRHPTTANQ